MKPFALFAILALLSMSLPPGLLAEPAPSPVPMPAVANGSPVAIPTPSTPEQLKALAGASLEKLQKYNYGDSTEALFNVLEALRKGTPETRTQLGDRLVTLLQESSTTAAAKETICRWLGWMGEEKSVPVLVKIAKSSANSPSNTAGSIGDYAISALATIPTKTADKALLNLLAIGNKDRMLSVMSALRIRRTEAAIPKLVKIAGMKSPELSEAALGTLASFRTTEALKAILNADVAEANAKFKDAAVVNASAGLLRNKQAVLPRAATQKLIVIAGSKAPETLRLSAIRVLLAARLPAGKQQAVALLKSEDFRLRAGAAESLAEFATPDELEAISWNATPDAWVVLLKNLSQKADPAYLSVFQKALGSTDDRVRLAAIDGISSCGGIKNLETLTPLLTDSNAPVAQAAKSALARLNGEGVSARLIELEGSSTPGLSAVLLSTLADRQEHKALDAAIAATTSGDPALQAAGYEALSRLTTSGDLAKCLALVPSVKERNAEIFQKAVVRAAIFDASPASAATQIAAAFDQGDVSQKEILVNVLARLEVKEARDKLAATLNSPDVDLRKQVIRALSSSRNATSLVLLPVLAETGQSNSEKILALKGYIDTIAFLPEGDLSFSDRIKAYLDAWKLAQRDEEKTAIRSAVKKLPVSKIQNNKEAKKLLQAIDAPAASTVTAAGAQTLPAKLQ